MTCAAYAETEAEEKMTYSPTMSHYEQDAIPSKARVKSADLDDKWRIYINPLVQVLKRQEKSLTHIHTHATDKNRLSRFVGP